MEAGEVDLGAWDHYRVKLTTISPVSSYGEPVLRLEDENGVIHDYRPEDLIPTKDGLLSAYELADRLASEKADKLTPEEERVLESFGALYFDAVDDEADDDDL